MFSLRHAWAAVAAVILVAGTAHAQVAGPFAAPAARVARAGVNQSLAGASTGAPEAIVRAYLLAAGHDQATVASLTLGSSGVGRTGVTHLRFGQRVAGLDVYGVYVKASVRANGELMTVIENLVPAGAAGGDGGPGAEARALAVGLQHIYGGALAPPGLVRQQGNVAVFQRTPFFHREPTVTRVAVPVGNALRVGYLVETWSERGNQLHHTLVGGDGAVLGVEVRTNSDTYNVFLKDPLKTAQQIMPGAGTGNAESPSGWLFADGQRTTSIAGNNVHAYLDTDADNADDGGGETVTDGTFEASADLLQQPSTAENQKVAVQNLFYLNNVLHDRLYVHGFTETVGNFQEDNFGNGGLGSDSVNAEVQDGSGTDNANFATPADGSNPRMQMYLWLGLGTHQVAVDAPTRIAGVYIAQGAGFGPAFDASGITGDIVVANDGVGVASDACERMPRNSLAGVIALVDRGTCNFDAKVTNAQRAGAIAVIVANNAAGEIFTMGGSTNTRIPAVMISQADGAVLKSETGVHGTVGLAETAPLSRDSSLDADVVYHEYGHGLTWRMIGSMSGVMSGAIGEGMSDVLALLLNNLDSEGDDVVGEYSAGDALGIRSAPYTGYQRTYGDFSGSGVHIDGEIYGAIGWRLRENFLNAGLDTGLLLDYLVDGMNHTPAGPAFEDMRDGILAATDGSGHECLVWDAFADFGVGVGASAKIRGPRAVITESFALPAQCSALPLR